MLSIDVAGESCNERIKFLARFYFGRTSASFDPQPQPVKCHALSLQRKACANPSEPSWRGRKPGNVLAGVPGNSRGRVVVVAELGLSERGSMKALPLQLFRLVDRAVATLYGSVEGLAE